MTAFEVFPYTTEDIVVGGRLLDAGCEVLMPWGAPIGSGRGLNNLYGLRTMRQHFPDVRRWWSMPASACPRMRRRRWSWAMTRVLLNTAVAKAGNPALMAQAFAMAVEAGRQACAARPDGAARHGGSLHAGHGQGLPVMKLDPFYPIFDSVDWIERMLPLGVKLVQLRVKDRPEAELGREIAKAKRLCDEAGCVLDRQRLLAPRHRRRAATSSISARRISTPPISPRSGRPG